MSYQVLARKWRPHTFSEVIGQQHVLKALGNALDQGRLHHAYLLSGTRGVGKTTIARILAKSLNCETGITSRPCGQCSACREIDQGNFVDLLEIDAASRTKVEDTREILDNVQYRPARGRFKVYLIDEVHMLSRHSFNALLKTLEEPPEHVKFLLATTDPQKLPVTILSRCLQFHLKSLTIEQIVGQLGHVLRQEGNAFQPAALDALAKAADGSMRDALSLADQALAFGSGELLLDDVLAMLGTLDHRQIYRLLHYVAAADAQGLIHQVAELVSLGADFEQVHLELASILHRIAMAQVLSESNQAQEGDDEIGLLAGQLAPSDVQLFYQMAINGKRDLPYAPDGRVALEMTLLRMLAFSPAAVTPQAAGQPRGRVEQGVAAHTPAPKLRAAASDAVAPLTSPSAASVEPHTDPVPLAPSQPDVTGAEPPDNRAAEAARSAVQTTVPAMPNDESESVLSALETPSQGEAAKPEDVAAPVSSSRSQQAPETGATSPSEATEGLVDRSLDNILKARNFLRSNSLRNKKLQQSAPSGGDARTRSDRSRSNDPGQALRQADKGTDEAGKVVSAVPEPKPFSVVEPPMLSSDGVDEPPPPVSEMPPWLTEDVQDDSEPVSHSVSNRDSLPPEPADCAPEVVQSGTDDGKARSVTAEQHGVSMLPEGAGLSKSPDKMVDLAEVERTEVWRNVIERANISGRLRQLAMNACVRLRAEGGLTLVVQPQQKHLAKEQAKALLAQAFMTVCGECGDIEFEIGDPQQETPLEMDLRLQQERWQKAKADLLTDDNVQFFMQRFAAQLVEESIKPK